MISNIILLTAAVAANAYISGKALQEPAFDFRFAIPQPLETGTDLLGSRQESTAVAGDNNRADKAPQSSTFFSSAGVAPHAQSTYTLEVDRSDPLESKLVTTSFHGTRAADVLSWLEHEGVSFIITDDSLRSKTITMNIVKQPLGSTIDGVAAALGGHWLRKGSIRIFQSGLDGFGGLAVPMDSRGFFHVPLKPGDRAFFHTNPDSSRFGQAFGGSGKGTVTINGKSIPISQLVGSLSPRQRGTMRTKGFLDRSDLTPDQIEMLGLKPDVHMKIVIEANGEKITIQNP